MSAARLRRGQQVERNREQLLAAARRVFLERGFQAATLDAIADAAGFSKGVVYSQFDSKADLFLALLERRIGERAAENERVVARGSAPTSLLELLRTAEHATAAEPAWSLLLLEFRVYAARNPAVNARYAALHARTVERLASVLRAARGNADGRDTEPPETMATFVLAFAAGAMLENLATPRPSDGALRTMVARALGVDAGPAAAGRPPRGKDLARRPRAVARRTRRKP